MNNITATLNYFNYFKNKDIKMLNSMLAENVEWLNWNGTTKNKEQYINETRDVFDSSDIIDVEIVNIASNLNTVLAELVITIGSEDTKIVAQVMKSLKFNYLGLITDINVYSRSR